MTDDHQTPTEALAAIEKSRRAVHDRVATGGWRYDLTYSALMAGMVGGQALTRRSTSSRETVGLMDWW